MTRKQRRLTRAGAARAMRPTTHDRQNVSVRFVSPGPQMETAGGPVTSKLSSSPDKARRFLTKRRSILNRSRNLKKELRWLTGE